MLTIYMHIYLLSHKEMKNMINNWQYYQSSSRKFLCLEISSYGQSVSNTDEKKIGMTFTMLLPSFLIRCLFRAYTTENIATRPSFGLMLNQYSTYL